MKDDKRRMKSIREIIKLLKEEGVEEFQDGTLKIVLSKSVSPVPIPSKGKFDGEFKAPLEIVTAEEIFNKEFEELSKLNRGTMNGNHIL